MFGCTLQSFEPRFVLRISLVYFNDQVENYLVLFVYSNGFENRYTVEPHYSRYILQRIPVYSSTIFWCQLQFFIDISIPIVDTSLKQAEF